MKMKMKPVKDDDVKMSSYSFKPVERTIKLKDLGNLKYVLDVCLKSEKKSICGETIAYCKDDFPKDFYEKFDKCFTEVIGKYAGYKGGIENSVPASPDSSDFESYFKFVSYKGFIFAFRLMFGQGSSEDIWVFDFTKAKYDWVGDQNAYEAWKKCTGRFGYKEVIQEKELGPQECHGDPDDIESYSQQVLEDEIAIYGLMTDDALFEEVLSFNKKAGSDKFIEFALKNLPRHMLIEFLREKL